MRLDVYLAEKGLASSRTEAKKMIDNGLVSVSGVTVTKPSYDVDCSTDIVDCNAPEKRFASRGGVKLEGAIDAFGIAVAMKKCIDIGASSGGFTDCLLQHGAAHVIAVDSGRGQMVETLRNDNRVTVIEGFNARYMSPKDFEYVPELAVMDVSFISARLIIPAVAECLASGGDYVLLIKPQFEVGRAFVGKGGIVKDASARDRAVRDVVTHAEVCGFELKGLITSPIQGGDGNTEFFAHFRKK